MIADLAAKHRIKAATRDLISACGGLERASRFAGVGTTQLSRFQNSRNPEDIDCLISLQAAMALQRECGVAYVTAAMAEIEGRTLSDPAVLAAQANLGERYSTTIGAIGAMLASMAEAMADGKLTACEADRLDRMSGAFDIAYAGWRQVLSAVKAGEQVG